LDGSDATIGGTALSTARLIGQSYATKVLTEQAALTGRPSAFNPPLEVRTQVWYNPDLIAAYFNVPGVAGMILYFITALLTASSIVRERERGTIEQLIVTPIRSWELVVGKILPYTILAFIDLIEVLVVGHWWFHVPIRGDLGLIFALSGLFLLSSLGIGLFASTIANNQQEAFITVMFTMLPSIFLSGFFFPIEAMPKFLQYVSAIIPLRYYLVIIRALLLKGVGAESLQPEILALTIFAIAILGDVRLGGSVEQVRRSAWSGATASRLVEDHHPECVGMSRFERVGDEPEIDAVRSANETCGGALDQHLIRTPGERVDEAR
jgi:ABC-2 type transport system permease protein